MADQQFCLRWNNHQSTLISVFDSLLERGAMVDCTLAAEGQCLQAHKVVLSACSPYLETLLSQHYDKHPILLLKDVKFYELQAMMDYMYRGEVNVAQDKLGMFLKAAESLQIKGLSDSGGNEPPDTGGGSSKRTSKGVPVTNIPRSGGGLTVERRRPQQPLAASQVVDIPSDSGSQDGSESPNLRRKRRRRTSGGGDSAVEGDSSNAGDVSRTQSSSAPLSSDQVPMNGSADSNALGILSSLMDGSVETDSSVQEPGPSLGTSSQTQPSQRIREKLEPTSSEMIQPKAEYLESEENVEDLTLDDDNDTGMDAGPSQRQGSGYQWHMGDQSADEVFMAAQEAVGANRDAQGSAMFFGDCLLKEESLEAVAMTGSAACLGPVPVPQVAVVGMGMDAEVAVEAGPAMGMPVWPQQLQQQVPQPPPPPPPQLQLPHPQGPDVAGGMRAHCSVCGRGFKQTAARDAHFRIHTGEKPHSCPHCQMAFRLRGDMVAHIRVHTGERPFQCQYCRRTFAQRSTLRTHLLTHTGEKPVACELCPERFRHKATLGSHMKKVHQVGVGQPQPQGQPQGQRTAGPALGAVDMDVDVSPTWAQSPLQQQSQPRLPIGISDSVVS